MVCGLFFKQKTAYELRISDWSSDVCSSDLAPPPVTVKRARVCRQLRRFDKIVRKPDHDMLFARPHLVARRYQKGTGMAADSEAEHFRSGLRAFHPLEFSRSEEHTSELQSLLRISYAVFCLKQNHKPYNLK